MRAGTCLCTLALAVGISRCAAAQVASHPLTPSVPELRVPLGDNFSRFELVTTGVVLVAGIGILEFGEFLFGVPTPSLGPPAAGSFDRRWADRLHVDDGSGGRFLGRVPDIAGVFVPYLPGLVYGIGAVGIARGRGSWPFGDPNADHRLAAYAEALGWTALITGVTKLLVGRERPYVVLDHPELGSPTREHNLSFFSGHSSAMFAAASFVALDLSRRLPEGPLRDAPAVRRWLLGCALPYVVAYGAASLVAVSRVIDQQHWPTDVLVGALVGTGIAHLAYLTHFDGRGRPRRSRDTDSGMALRLVPAPGGVALVGLLP
jgi:membrane-associated phospholipid phosphatase